MEKSIGIAKARQSFSELVNRVAFGGERYLVQRRGKSLAALMNATEYHKLMELLEEGGVNDEVHGIPVLVRFDGERYFVSDDILDLYGVGKTLDEAREDYRVAVQDYYDDLLVSSDRLAGHLQEHLDFLRQLFADGRGEEE